MRNTLALCLALSLSCTAACADERLASDLNRRDLLAAAFPAWKPARDASGRPTQAAIPSVDMPAVKWPWLHKGSRSRRSLTGVNVTAMNVVQLDPDHAALVTLVLPDDAAHEQSCDSYSCTYALGAYFFEHDVAGWRLTHRDDVAATIVGSGAPRTHVREWPGHGYVVDATAENCHGGDCVSELALIGMAPNAKVFSFEATVGHDNEEQFGPPVDCTRLLDPAFEMPDGADLPPGECVSAKGSWRVDGDALRIDVDDLERTIDQDGLPGPLRRTQSFARLVPDHGTLKVVEGELPTYGL